MADQQGIAHLKLKMEQNNTLSQELQSARTDEEAVAFAAKAGVEVPLSDMRAYRSGAAEEGELSEADLAKTAGGCWPPACGPKHKTRTEFI